jgi:hypothetical protein
MGDCHPAGEATVLPLLRHTGMVDTPPARRHRIGYMAPVAWIDLAAFDEAGEPCEIRPCNYCLPWHAEVHIDEDSRMFVREWHAVDCEEFRQLLESVRKQP